MFVYAVYFAAQSPFAFLENKLPLGTVHRGFAFVFMFGILLQHFFAFQVIFHLLGRAGVAGAQPAVVIIRQQLRRVIAVAVILLQRAVYGHAQRRSGHQAFFAPVHIFVFIQKRTFQVGFNFGEIQFVHVAVHIRPPYIAKNAPGCRRIFPRGKFPVLPARQTARFCAFAAQ